MGATRQWKIDSPKPHTVRIQYSLGTRMIVYVDGVRVPVERVSGYSHFDDVCDYQFQMDDVPCRLSLNIEKPCQLWIGDQLQPDPFTV